MLGAGGRQRRMVSLGKVTAPKPVNLPSQKKENNGNDPNVNLVPKAGTWGENPTPGSGTPPSEETPKLPPRVIPAQPSPAWGGAGLPEERQRALEIASREQFPTLGAGAHVMTEEEQHPHHHRSPPRGIGGGGRSSYTWDDDERGPYAGPPGDRERGGGGYHRDRYGENRMGPPPPYGRYQERGDFPPSSDRYGDHDVRDRDGYPGDRYGGEERYRGSSWYEDRFSGGGGGGGGGGPYDDHHYGGGGLYPPRRGGEGISGPGGGDYDEGSGPYGHERDRYGDRHGGHLNPHRGEGSTHPADQQQQQHWQQREDLRHEAGSGHHHYPPNRTVPRGSAPPPPYREEPQYYERYGGPSPQPALAPRHPAPPPPPPRPPSEYGAYGQAAQVEEDQYPPQAAQFNHDGPAQNQSAASIGKNGAEYHGAESAYLPVVPPPPPPPPMRRDGPDSALERSVSASTATSETSSVMLCRHATAGSFGSGAPTLLSEARGSSLIEEQQHHQGSSSAPGANGGGFGEDEGGNGFPRNLRPVSAPGQRMAPLSPRGGAHGHQTTPTRILKREHQGLAPSSGFAPVGPPPPQRQQQQQLGHLSLEPRGAAAVGLPFDVPLMEHLSLGHAVQALGSGAAVGDPSVPRSMLPPALQGLSLQPVSMAAQFGGGSNGVDAMSAATAELPPGNDNLHSSRELLQQSSGLFSGVSTAPGTAAHPLMTFSSVTAGGSARSASLGVGGPSGSSGGMPRLHQAAAPTMLQAHQLPSGPPPLQFGDILLPSTIDGSVEPDSAPVAAAAAAAAASGGIRSGLSTQGHAHQGGRGGHHGPSGGRGGHHGKGRDHGIAGGAPPASASVPGKKGGPKNRTMNEKSSSSMNKNMSGKTLNQQSAPPPPPPPPGMTMPMPMSSPSAYAVPPPPPPPGGGDEKPSTERAASKSRRRGKSKVNGAGGDDVAGLEEVLLTPQPAGGATALHRGTASGSGKQRRGLKGDHNDEIHAADAEGTSIDASPAKPPGLHAITADSIEDGSADGTSGGVNGKSKSRSRRGKRRSQGSGGDGDGDGEGISAPPPPPPARAEGGKVKSDSAIPDTIGTAAGGKSSRPARSRGGFNKSGGNVVVSFQYESPVTPGSRIPPPPPPPARPAAAMS